MVHPPAVREKAQRLEQLLLRLEAGERFDQVCADLDLSLEAEEMPRFQAKYRAGGRQWEALIDGRYGHPQKAHCERSGGRSETRFLVLYEPKVAGYRTFFRGQRGSLARTPW